MKKLLALLLALAMIMALAACGPATTPTDPVMLKKSISRLIVADNDQNLLGIVTRTDLINIITNLDKFPIITN